MNEQDESGLTALHYAASTLANRAIDRLLSHPGIDATIADQFGRSAATVAHECWNDVADNVVEKLNPHCYPWLYETPEDSSEPAYVDPIGASETVVALVAEPFAKQNSIETADSSPKDDGDKGRPPQDVYVLRSYHQLGREITAVLPCTLWAALGFPWFLRNTALRQELMWRFHGIEPFQHQRTIGRSITTWGAAALPQDPTAMVEISALPLGAPIDQRGIS